MEMNMLSEAKIKARIADLKTVAKEYRRLGTPIAAVQAAKYDARAEEAEYLLKHGCEKDYIVKPEKLPFE